MGLDINYKSLNPPHTKIRLIKLHPKSPDDEDDVPSCDLEYHTRGLTPPYTALSYAWESPHQPGSILVNNKPATVSANVSHALRDLQSDQGRWVWVDQLCINQEDDEEKSCQVQQMRQIYSEAELVQVWIGEAWDNSNLLFTHMRETGEALMRKDYEELSRIHEDEKRVADVTEAFRQFSATKYWTRLWVMQEFSVGRNTVIVCGKASIDAEVASYAIFSYWTTGYAEIPKLKETYPFIDRVQPVYSSTAKSFVDSVFGRRDDYQKRDEVPEENVFFKVLTISLAMEVDDNHPETSDDRDRVFSLLPLALDADDFVGFPDYSWSCERVYTELALGFLMQGEIDVLAFSQFPKSRSDLPSWAPDWSDRIRVPCSYFPFRNDFEAGMERSDQRISRLDDKRIQIRGVAVDTIKEVSSIIWDPDWSKWAFNDVDARAYVESIRKFCHSSPRVMIGEEDLTTARIAIGDESGDDDLGGRWQDNYLESLNQFLEETKPGGTNPRKDGDNKLATANITHNEPDDTWYRQLRRMHSRRAYISSSGYVGLAPMHVEVGDELVVFLNSKTPYAIRSNNNGTHSLIGEAYVHGIMYGEMFKDDEVEVKDFILI